jgi:FkbM family methyltransferase
LGALNIKFAASHEKFNLDLEVPFETLGSLFAEHYEVSERLIAQRIAGPGDRYLEAGAGLGMVTCILGRAGATVFALEPIQEYFDITQRNIKMNGVEATLQRAGLGPDNGWGTAYRRVIGYGSSLLPNVEGQDPIISTERVDIIGINAAVAEWQINALHLDVEGLEVALLDALDFSPIQKITMEVHVHLFGQALHGRILQRLEDNGFGRAFILPASPWPPQTYSLVTARDEAALWPLRDIRVGRYASIVGGEVVFDGG